jgi:hypothetical protein
LFYYNCCFSSQSLCLLHISSHPLWSWLDWINSDLFANFDLSPDARWVNSVGNEHSVHGLCHGGTIQSGSELESAQAVISRSHHILPSGVLRPLRVKGPVSSYNMDGHHMQDFEPKELDPRENMLCEPYKQTRKAAEGSACQMWAMCRSVWQRQSIWLFYLCIWRWLPTL